MDNAVDRVMDKLKDYKNYEFFYQKLPWSEGMDRRFELMFPRDFDAISYAVENAEDDDHTCFIKEISFLRGVEPRECALLERRDPGDMRVLSLREIQRRKDLLKKKQIT